MYICVAYVKCSSLADANVTFENFINRLTVRLFHDQPCSVMCDALIPISLFSKDVTEIHLIYITFAVIGGIRVI